MNIHITSVVWEDVATEVSAATAKLERVLHSSLAENYGSDIDVLFTVVAVSSDADENRRFTKEHDKVGYYKRWPSDERRRFWSMGVELIPEALEAQSAASLQCLIAAGMRREIEAPKKKPPKLFDYPQFRADALAALRGT